MDARDDPGPAEWERADAWVLAAVEGTAPDDASTLVQLLVKAEGINHAGLLEAELTRAVPRLVHAGVLGVGSGGDRYWHTPAGRDLYVRRMRRHGLFTWDDALLPALRRLGPPRDGDWALPAGAFGSAAAEAREVYRRRR